MSSFCSPALYEPLSAHLLYVRPLLLAELAEIRLESAAILVQDGAALLQLLRITCTQQNKFMYFIQFFLVNVYRKEPVA
jgi:hypothetical protein